MKGGRSKKKCLEDRKKGVNLYQCTVFYRELDSLSLLDVIGKPLIKSYCFTEYDGKVSMCV